jgi:1-acyl-sn-glycerol-3-phosphate acyltransferase
MIEARKTAWFEKLFYLYNGRLIRRWFNKVYVRIDPNGIPEGPTLFIANHSSWWDGLFAFHLNYSLLKYDAFVMMSESGLKKFSFFRKLGAFSINRDSPKDIIKSMRYAMKCLIDFSLKRNIRGRSLWMFPQGDIRHQDIRPLSFLPGLAFLLEKVKSTNLNITVVPVTFYYDFGLEQKPSVYISIGSPVSTLNVCAQLNAQSCQLAVINQLDEMRDEIIRGEPQRYSTLLYGKESTSVRFVNWFKHRNTSQ